VSAGRLDVVDEVPVDAARARIYAEGWQSWSPATWYPVGSTGLRPSEEWQHTMRFRPGTPIAPEGLQGEGLLAIDPGDGSDVRCYGTTSPLEIPTITATLVDAGLLVRSSGAVVSSAAADAESVLAAYADAFAQRAGSTPSTGTPPPSVWCSWYRYFEEITAADVLENVRALDEHDLVVDVVQVDDGWSPGLGEGLVVADRFGSLDAVVEEVRATGRRVGIWVAPFVVGARSTLATQRPQWVVGDAGRNWGDDLVGLDLTHPGVVDLLAETFTRLVDRGIDYFKLDFLYGGAVPGRRLEGMTGVEAYRSGMSLIREVVGPGAVVVGCGAPILPSVGLVDAMRVSPDTFHEGGEDGSHGLRGLMPLAARAWQQGRFWVNDPDCLVARPSYAERDRWSDAVAAFGGLASFSDRVGDLDDHGLTQVRALLARGGTAEPFAAETVRLGAEVAEVELR
jgi:alpha-galactosidase